jgi:murein L,D-transpeptidase YafK
LAAIAVFCLAACQDSDIPKALKPVPRALVAQMDRQDMEATSPIFIRLYKESSEMEIWKQKRNGDYALLKTYSICKWSGVLGPKIKEGDRQAPEGIYIVTPAQMNPASHYYLSFNIGYPNAFDRAWGRTGSNLMVHGACSSSGCYSMTDEDAGEIFSLARDSFRGGQRSFQIQAMPFRMTAENLAKHATDPNMPFWRMLKVGTDSFDLTLRPPKVDVCDKRYVFNADAGGETFNASAPCPAYSIPENLSVALAKKQADDDAAFNVALANLGAKEKAAADKAALALAKEEDTGARPSLIQRIINRFKPGDEPTAAATPVAINASAPATPLTSLETQASVPMPRLRPDAAGTAPVVVPATTATIAPPSTVAPAATLPPADTPAVGKVVKKPFFWPGDDDVVTGDDTSG